MLLPAEIEAKLTIPVLRAIVARKLIKEHGYMQKNVADAMGVTQASISNYVRGARARLADWGDDPAIKRRTEEIVRAILQRRNAAEIAAIFNHTLTYIRMKRLMCDLHRKLEPIDVDACHLCDS